MDAVVSRCRHDAALAVCGGVRVRSWKDLRDWHRLALIALTLAGVLVGVRVFRPILPPVPLRLTRLRFSGTLAPHTLATSADFEKEIPAKELRRGRIYAVATIFSPERIPAQMQMRFLQHGKVLRASRTLDLTTRPGGFRIWDSVRVPQNGSANSVRVEVWTGGQLLGKRDVRVVR
jgi:hypothetical protein